MSSSLVRIKKDFDAFCQRVETYRENVANPNRKKDSCEAAYEGLYKLIQRIKKEFSSGALSQQESSIFCEIRDDNYLNGLLELRTVAAHIQSDTARKRGAIYMYAPSGPQVEIPSEVSAGYVFSKNTFVLREPSFGISTINHLENLDVAKERIAKKLERVGWGE